MDMAALERWIDWTLDQPWVFYATAGLLGLFGLRAAYAGLLGDRARGRRRCPRCWYDLRGSPLPRCSECGFVAKRERQFFRARRRWRLAAVGFLLLGGAGSLSLAPKIRRDGWLSVVPTTALLLASAAGGSIRGFPPSPPADPIGAELDRRGAAAHLADWQWAYIVRDKVSIRHRKRWPAGVALIVETYVPGWLIGVGRLEFDTPLALRSESLPSFPAGITSAHLDATLLVNVQPRTGRWHAEKAVWRGQIALPIEFVPRIEDVLQLCRGAEIDALMGRAIHVAVCRYAHGIRVVEATIDRTLDPRLSDFALGLSLRLTQEGRTLADAELVDVFGDGLCVFWIIGDGASRQWNPDETPGAIVHVRGNPEMALRDWDRNKCWVGEFSVPLQDLIKSR